MILTPHWHAALLFVQGMVQCFSYLCIANNLLVTICYAALIPAHIIGEHTIRHILIDLLLDREGGGASEK